MVWINYILNKRLLNKTSYVTDYFMVKNDFVKCLHVMKDTDAVLDFKGYFQNLLLTKDVLSQL